MEIAERQRECRETERARGGKRHKERRNMEIAQRQRECRETERVQRDGESEESHSE